MENQRTRVYYGEQASTGSTFLQRRQLLKLLGGRTGEEEIRGEPSAVVLDWHPALRMGFVGPQFLATKRGSPSVQVIDVAVMREHRVCLTEICRALQWRDSVLFLRRKVFQ